MADLPFQQAPQNMGVLARFLASIQGAPLPDPGTMFGRPDENQPPPPTFNYLSGRATTDAAPAPIDAPPSTNDPFSSEPALFSGGVPLPRPRPPEAGANPSLGPIAGEPAPFSMAPGAGQDAAALPQVAAPAMGQGSPAAAPQAPAAPPSVLSGIGDKLGGLAKGMRDKATDPNTAATRLALAAGFAGAPSFGTGMSRAFSAAGPAMQADIGNQRINQTAKALVAKGIPPEIAMAAAGNPALLAQILPQAFGAKQRKFTQIGEDMMGNKQFGFVDEVNGKTYDMSGNAVGGGASGGGTEFLAKGVKEFNNQLSGDEYLNQFAPEVKSAIKGYVNGETMPTGNPRKGFTQFVINAAKKYGNDVGLPTDDVKFGERKKLRTDLASSGNSSMGGILSNGDSAFKHLAEFSDSASGLKNYSLDFPGGGNLAVAGNYIGNVVAPTSKTKGQIVAARDNLMHYGQESTKFYSATGGGEGERMAALREVNPETRSSEEMAAYIEKEKGLMLDRMNSKFQHIRDVLGDEEAQKIIAKKTPSLNETIAKIDSNVSRLRGQPAPQAHAPAPAPQQITPDIALTQARQAIARGAPRDAVIQRLQQSGVNPAGL